MKGIRIARVAGCPTAIFREEGMSADTLYGMFDFKQSFGAVESGKVVIRMQWIGMAAFVKEHNSCSHL